MAYIDKITVNGTDYDIHDSKSTINILLLSDEIPNTVQSVSFDSNGNVSSISHVSGSTTIRTDAFTFGTGTITEVRTLNTGENLTIITNLTTLQTTITYSDS